VSAPAVEVRHLVKQFGAFRAVDDISLTVQPGEVFGFLGSNGAGKSTTIRMLCGLLRPSGGEARVLGIDVAKDPEAVKRRIGYMSQRFSLYDDLTVAQNLVFFGGVYGLHGPALPARIAWAVEMAGLGGQAGRLTRELPGGWKQKLALACSVLHDPGVLFLDEPTSGVDPISRRRFWALIDTLAARGVTVFVTTHYLDEAEHCHRIAIVHAGRLAALGTVGELKQVFAGRAVLEVTADDVAAALEVLSVEDWVLETSVFGTRLHVVVRDEAEGRARLEGVLAGAGQPARSVRRVVPSLEDVFIHHVRTETATAPAGAR
jgi:ABC-2 type transport system ATP-binding protein